MKKLYVVYQVGREIHTDIIDWPEPKSKSDIEKLKVHYSEEHTFVEFRKTYGNYGIEETIVPTITIVSWQTLS